MAIHKLNFIVNFYDYYLIAYIPLEDYRLAYFINQKLPINLSKVEMKFKLRLRREKQIFQDFL
jgi:hypothetical protein